MVEKSEPPTQPAGQPKSMRKAILEAGADLLQDVTPVKQFDVYVVGFHPMKHDPDHQMEAHHYCKQVNDDLIQCVLFDGNTKDANLIGLEYIVSERLYDSLPENEQSYWHPHNYEILSGTLVAPGLPDAAEKALMRTLMNSYGKTWHTWMSGKRGEPGDTLPLGDPHLMWSFNRDGEAEPGLVESRDEALGVDSVEKRRDRADLAELAHPQRGVDALKGAFPGAAEEPPPGVEDAEASRTTRGKPERRAGR